jgi:hypothetical protein
VANIIVELNQEMMRVRALLPKMDAGTREKALATVEDAKCCLALNYFGGVRESIDALREFGGERKK